MKSFNEAFCTANIQISVKTPIFCEQNCCFRNHIPIVMSDVGSVIGGHERHQIAKNSSNQNSHLFAAAFVLKHSLCIICDRVSGSVFTASHSCYVGMETIVSVRNQQNCQGVRPRRGVVRSTVRPARCRPTAAGTATGPTTGTDCATSRSGHTPASSPQAL